MKRKNHLSLVFGLIILFNNQIVFSQKSETNLPQSQQKQCTAFIEGIEFCLDSAFISFNIDQDVILRYTIKNLTEREIAIHGGGRGGYRLLHLIVTDKNGNKIPTILEVLTEKQKTEILTKEESSIIISFLAYSGPGSTDFEPNQEKKPSINLNDLYYFKNSGGYFVEIYKKEHKQDGTIYPKTLLGRVEVEIK
jgi:hypothetical protein